MEQRAFRTRITEETHRRLKVQAALLGRTMEEIAEEALRDWLAVAESAELEKQA